MTAVAVTLASMSHWRQSQRDVLWGPDAEPNVTAIRTSCVRYVCVLQYRREELQTVISNQDRMCLQAVTAMCSYRSKCVEPACRQL